MAIVNLPREVGFKWQNIIVYGVIPGPSEPKFNINSYLKPIVDELKKGWERIMLKTAVSFEKFIQVFPCLFIE